MRHGSGLRRTGLNQTSRAAWPLAVIGALVLHASHASAEPQPRAAVAASKSAVELAAGACRLERWAAAVDLMRVAERQARSAEAWLCLARAQLHTGQWVAALDSYDELAESEAPTANERTPVKDRVAKELEARQLGAVERQELEARLGWLEIVPSSPLPASAKLSLDGEPIARSRIGVAFPVQPGTHVFTLELHGVVRELDPFRVAQSERRRVTLSISTQPLARQAVAPLRVVERQPQASPHPTTELTRWANGALYAGGIGVGSGIALLAISSGGGDFHEGTLRAGLGSLLLGGMALFTGGALYLGQFVSSSPNEAPPEPALRLPVEPWVSSNAAGVSGSF